jgi:hypothetical protein
MFTPEYQREGSSMQDTTRPWGQHLILDFAGCPQKFLTDISHLRAWVSELVEAG